MFFNWKGISFTLLGLAAALLFCAFNLHCGGDPAQTPTALRVKEELAAGKAEMRYQKAEELAALARDLRQLAAIYTKNGEKKKAHHAIGAAQELDRKIRALRGE